MSLKIDLLELFDESGLVDTIEAKFCELLEDLSKRNQKKVAWFYLQGIVDYINAIDDDYPVDSVLDIVGSPKN